MHHVVSVCVLTELFVTADNSDDLSTLCPKKLVRFNLLKLGQKLTDFQNSFTARKLVKFGRKVI